MEPLEQLIVALDFPTQQQAMQMVDKLGGCIRWVKVGLELYLAEGNGIVKELQTRGLKVFLDLKLHDIPNTVAAAVRVAGDTGASLLTVHAGGGPAMLAAAAAAAPSTLQLLGVTVLTSMDEAQLRATGVPEHPQTQVVRLGELAVSQGLSGLICSPKEITALRASAAGHSKLIVPGIRASDASRDDQHRTATAAEAIRLGADMIVVGRPITRTADPLQATRNVLLELRSPVIAL